MTFLQSLGLVTCLLLAVSCDNDSLNNMDLEGTIWDGPTVTFTKQEGADPTQEANQDRITANVWITRGNAGGQIYNAAVENDASKADSPEGTLWAQGTLDEIDNLDFRPFRDAVGQPKDVVGQDLVVYLEEDQLYLSVRFTDWSQNMGGGFAYERSSEP